MSGNDEQDELDNELEQEQSEMESQKSALATRQKKVKDAEIANMKRVDGQAIDASALGETEDDDDEEPLG